MANEDETNNAENDSHKTSTTDDNTSHDDKINRNASHKNKRNVANKTEIRDHTQTVDKDKNDEQSKNERNGKKQASRSKQPASGPSTQFRNTGGSPARHPRLAPLHPPGRDDSFEQARIERPHLRPSRHQRRRRRHPALAAGGRA